VVRRIPVAVQKKYLRATPIRVRAALKKEPRPQRRAEATRERILDAAEKLFAQRGFHGCSIRDITGAAAVDVALANYHFGSKQSLLEAVVMRRAEDLNQERVARLDAVLAPNSRRRPKLEEIIDAFTHPLLDRSTRGSPGWKSYFALIAEVNNSPEFGGVLMTRYFDPVVERFIEAMRLALPDASDRDIYWAYHFLSGALTLTFAETGRIDKLSGGVCRSVDLDSVHERLVPYCAAGFRALCQPTRKAAAPRQAKVASTRRLKKAKRVTP
jgi:AcrR family transcriptional regulator